MSQTEKTFIITESLLTRLISHIPLIRDGTSSIPLSKLKNNNPLDVLENALHWAGCDIQSILSNVERNDASEIQRNSDFWERAAPYLRTTLTKQQLDELTVVIDKESMELLRYLASDEVPAK